MLNENNEKPGVDEQYSSACSTSNLTVEADRKGAGDILVAAGWSPSRVGMALLRLHGEWDSMSKPRRIDVTSLAALTEVIKRQDIIDKRTADRIGAPFKSPGSASVRASDLARKWYSAELQILAFGLKSRPVVWEQMQHWMNVKRVPADKVAAALAHWLNPTCMTCDGHGLRRVPDQPSLSARQCHKCNGTGHNPAPHGSTPILNYFDDCLQKARQSLKNRLHNN
jgi:hypothetical protein